MHKTFRHTLPLFSLLLLLLLAQSRAPVHAFSGDYTLDFDGIDDYVILGETDTILHADWETTKTISLWIRPIGIAATPSQNDVGWLDHIIGDRPRWWGISRGLYNDGSGAADRIWVWNYDGNYDVIGIEYTPGQWLHITMVHDGVNLVAYKNGKEVASIASGATQRPITGATPNIYLGGMIVNAEKIWTYQGQIDEVELWNDIRTSEEIRQSMFRYIDVTNPPVPDLAAYYRMSDGPGNILLTDDSGNGNIGTFYNIDANNVWTTSGAFSGPRNTLTFDGSDDYVSLGSNGSTVIGAGWASTKSVELWAKPAGAAPIVGTAAAGNVLFAGTQWGISQVDLGAGDKLYVWNNDSSESALPIDYTTGEWIHVTLVHDGVNLAAYRNGVNVGSIASGSTASDGDLFIGGFSGGQRFQGQIDEVRLWSDVRTQTEIQDNMFATVAHDEAGLAAYYRMDQENDSTVTTVYDSAKTSAAAHNGAMINMAPASAWAASTAFNTWIGGDSGDWASDGNWSRYAAPISSHNVGLTNYLASNAPVISTAATANNLTISSDAIVIIDSDIGGNLTASGTLLNNGRIQQSQTVNATPVNFANTGGYGGVTIDPGSANMGVTTVTIKGNQQCTTNNNEAVLRCFDIEPTTAPSNPGATITFYFADSEIPSTMNCTDIDAFHYDINTSTWESSALNPVSRDCSGPLNSITVSGVTNFSPFVLAESVPTAVSLQTVTIHENGWRASLLAAGLLLLATGGLLTLRRKKQAQSV